MITSQARLKFGSQDALCTPTGLLAVYAAAYFQDITIVGEQDWYLQDTTGGRTHIYKVTSIHRGTKAEDQGVPTTCSLNALMAMELPRPSELVTCAAVSIDCTGCFREQGGTERMISEFQKCLFLKDVSEGELKRARARQNVTVVEAKSRRMK